VIPKDFTDGSQSRAESVGKKCLINSGRLTEIEVHEQSGTARSVSTANPVKKAMDKPAATSTYGLTY
jgi:hypothetical protein